MSTLDKLANLKGFLVSGTKIPKVTAIYNAVVGEGEDYATKLIALKQFAEENAIECKLPRDGQANVDDVSCEMYRGNKTHSKHTNKHKAVAKVQ